jgi:DNA mismatch repair protein MutS
MTAQPSILFLDARGDEAAEPCERPEFFADLNLDEVVDAVTAGHRRHGLEPFYFRPLRTVDAILYRQEVARDLEDMHLLARIAAFSDTLRSVRFEVTQSSAMHNVHQGHRMFVEAAATYVDAITDLSGDLAAAGIASRGLLSVRDHVTAYASSPEFAVLREDIRAVRESLDRVRYQMEVSGSGVKIRRAEGEADYSADVLACFAKFKQGEVVGHRSAQASSAQLSPVEAKILALVARLYPETFASLSAFSDTHRDFLDDAVVEFDREFHFFASYFEYIAPLRAAGLAFNYPVLIATSKRVDVVQAFDLALAYKLVSEGAPIVCNDVSLKGKERILVVTGPNQGGKTTFARMFGQLHYLASLGLPVPGTKSRLLLCDQLYSHFEKEEDLSNLVGRLEEELTRVRDILDRATPNSVIILNEMFTSTTLDDAVFLGTNVLERIIALDALCVSVTFIDEFASLSASTVSMMSTVEGDDSTRRTFKVVRRPADGLAYAAVLAQKHRLGYASLKERLGS